MVMLTSSTRGALLLIAVCCFCFPQASASRAFPLCVDSRAPALLAGTLGFCGHSGVSCCDADDDAALREEFKAMNVSNEAGCTSIVKDILCKRCLPSRSASVHDPFNRGGLTTAKSIPSRCTSPASSSLARSPHQDDMCVERISKGSYLSMAAHPDGTGRVFLSTGDGRIWLASVPAVGSGATLDDVRDGATPFLDLTDRVLGLMGVAFHQHFAANGRFFVSYICDSTVSPTCISSRAVGNQSSLPCRYQLVVAEFFANYKASQAIPFEVRRVFNTGLPQPQTFYAYDEQQGGQILFRPSDGHLYLVAGFGGQKASDHPFLGKIIRFNVDISGQSEHTSSSGDRYADKPEIFAQGLNSPSHCSFDSDRPSYFYCAEISKEQQEEVRLVGNYGSSSVKTGSLIIAHGHPTVSTRPSIVGGYVYRGTADTWLKGRYVYMYGFAAWAAEETPGSTQSYTTVRIPNIRCSGGTPLPCHSGGIGGHVLAFAEDNSRDAFVLATGGVYRVVSSSLCGAESTNQPQQPSLDFTWLLSQAQQLRPDLAWIMVLAPFIMFALYQMYKVKLCVPRQVTTPHYNCFGCWGSNSCIGSIMCCLHNTHIGENTSLTNRADRVLAMEANHPYRASFEMSRA